MKASGRMGGFPSQPLAAQSKCDDRQAFFLSWQPGCDSAPLIPEHPGCLESVRWVTAVSQGFR